MITSNNSLDVENVMVEHIIDKIMHAGYVIILEIAKSFKCFNEGEFTEFCMTKVVIF